MKTFFASLAAVAVSSKIEQLFVNHLSKFHISYDTIEEYMDRLAIFNSNYEKVVHHNKEHSYDEGFTMTLNQFATYTEEEFKQLRGFIVREGPAKYEKHLLPTKAINGDINWVEAGAVTDVKNQGQCGSCWSFSTTGCLEGAHFLATGELLSLSEQQFVDCSKGYGNLGCMGGLMDSAFDYAKDYAIDLESDYPYDGWSFGGCKLTKEGVVNVSSYADVPANDPAQLEAFLAKGPVSIAIDASGLKFQLYKEGIMSADSCGTNLDHGVLLVGMGTDDSLGKDYWLVKNSWGATWGESGFLRLERTADAGPGTCGLQQQASQAYV